MPDRLPKGSENLVVAFLPRSSTGTLGLLHVENAEADDEKLRGHGIPHRTRNHHDVEMPADADEAALAVHAEDDSCFEFTVSVTIFAKAYR